ncbi:MAG: hypothetical protein HC889_19295 [Synechococcaceae cyanobacterium SM1_2_3]|nr:hypothetical protein [Synechococcaceae cyanobacterium SM1_2_3]
MGKVISLLLVIITVEKAARTLQTSPTGQSRIDAPPTKPKFSLSKFSANQAKKPIFTAMSKF